MIKPKVGDLFQNRYKILKELGTGGMGTVLQARQTEPDRLVALKFLLGENNGDKEIIKRFYREFRLLSELSHPNIMTTYGLALDDQSLPFAICEYIEGTDLRRLILSGGAVPWRRTVAICIQVSDALQFAHDRGVIHRDLKPENIMLLPTSNTSLETVKVIDFGLSRASLAELDPSQKLTKTGELLGTPHYLSPETVMKPADAQSDIYALACIMFELLAGEKLFDADSAVGVLYHHVNTDPSTRFSEIEENVPKELLSLLTRMLAKSPEKRPRSMQHIKDELQEILSEPGEMSSGKKFQSQKKQQGAIFMGIAAGLILLVLTCIGAAKIRQQNRQKLPDESAISSSDSAQTAQKELKSIINKIVEERSNWKVQLLHQKAFTLCRSKRASLIPRDERYLSEAIYCEGLLNEGLSVTALNICKETDADAQAHDPAIMADGISIYNRGDLLVQLIMEQIFINWGQTENAKRKLEDSIRNRNPGSSMYWAKTVENALILQDSAVWTKMIHKCPMINDLVQISAVFRRCNRLAACAMCFAESKKLRFRNLTEEFLFQLEVASVELASGKTQSALGFLKKASTNDLSHLDSEEIARYKTKLATSLAFVGEIKGSMKYMRSSLEGEGMSVDKASMDKTTDALLNLSRTGTKKQLVDAIEIAISNNSLPLKQRCVILCNAAESLHNFSEEFSMIASCYAHDYSMGKDSQKLPRETKLRCLLLFARALKVFGLAQQSIQSYEAAISDLTKNGFPRNEDSGSAINVQSLDTAKIQLIELERACGNIKVAQALLKELSSTLREDSPFADILKNDYALGYVSEGPRIIGKAAGIGAVRQLIEIAMRSKQHDDAELALKKAKELSNKLDNRTRNAWEINIRFAEAFLRLEQHQSKQALTLLESISEKQLRKVLPASEQVNYRDELEFALNLVRTTQT